MGGRAWSEREMQFIRENLDKMTHEEMANELGRTYASVQVHAGRMSREEGKLRKTRRMDTYASKGEIVPGDEVGLLTVLEVFIKESDDPYKTWCRCICRCGHTVERSARDLKARDNHSCGCGKIPKRKNKVPRIRERSGPLPGTTGRMVTAWGETKNLQEWASDPRCQISQPSLSERLNKGMATEEAISTPPTKNNSASRKQVEIGESFNRLTLEEKWSEQRGNQKKTIGRFRCECGNATDAVVSQVKAGRIQSCGCLTGEKARESVIKRCTTHGMSNHPLYKQYNGMVARCTYPSMKHYKNYGGRGIQVCEEWLDSFETFRDWAMCQGWEHGLTIERKNNDLGYNPDNCRLATMKEQANNTRSNRIVEAFGELKNVAQWSEDSRIGEGVNYNVLFERLHKLGWDAERAITTPSRFASYY